MKATELGKRIGSIVKMIADRDDDEVYSEVIDRMHRAMYAIYTEGDPVKAYCELEFTLQMWIDWAVDERPVYRQQYAPKEVICEIIDIMFDVRLNQLGRPPNTPILIVD